MCPRTNQTVFFAIRRPLVWLIALAILAYGHSAALVQMLGPSHRHEAVSTFASPDLLHRFDHLVSDIRAWHDDVIGRLLPPEWRAHRLAYSHQHRLVPCCEGGTAHPHAHAAFERHHHDPHDGSVAALDSAHGDAAADPAGPGSAALPLALAPPWSMAVPQILVHGWKADPSSRWTDALLPLSDRPPRA